jgi:hypothetical protein
MGLPLWGLRFNPWYIHVLFVVDRVALGHVYLKVPCFALPLSLCHYSIFIFRSSTTDAVLPVLLDEMPHLQICKIFVCFLNCEHLFFIYYKTENSPE